MAHARDLRSSVGLCTALICTGARYSRNEYDDRASDSRAYESAERERGSIIPNAVRRDDLSRRFDVISTIGDPSSTITSHSRRPRSDTRTDTRRRWFSVFPTSNEAGIIIGIVSTGKTFVRSFIHTFIYVFLYSDDRIFWCLWMSVCSCIYRLSEKLSEHNICRTNTVKLLSSLTLRITDRTDLRFFGGSKTGPVKPRTVRFRSKISTTKKLFHKTTMFTQIFWWQIFLRIFNCYFTEITQFGREI